jgi:hypothetical protein
MTGAQILLRAQQVCGFSIMLTTSSTFKYYYYYVPIDAWIIANALQVGINHDHFIVFECGILKLSIASDERC